MTRRLRKTDPAMDAHIGSRIRLRRTLLGMTQEALANAIGMTFQQVQKYENGANRVSASMLHTLSGVLDVPVSFFFDCWEGTEAQPQAQANDGEEAQVPGNRALLEIARLFNGMTSDQRRALFTVAKAIGQPVQMAV